MGCVSKVRHAGSLSCGELRDLEKLSLDAHPLCGRAVRSPQSTAWQARDAQSQLVVVAISNESIDLEMLRR